MSIAYIGLGSNLGERERHISQAAEVLSAREDIRLLASSSLYESPALLKEGADPAWNVPFVNAVVQIDTELQPQPLLAVLQEIEQRLGKEKRGIWAPREIDLDILAYEDRIIETPELIIPHPHMHERAFVLIPMQEVVPDWCYPSAHDMLGGRSLRSLCQTLDSRYLEKLGPMP